MIRARCVVCLLTEVRLHCYIGGLLIQKKYVEFWEMEDHGKNSYVLFDLYIRSYRTFLIRIHMHYILLISDKNICYFSLDASKQT
jgi:hypothetical protein